MSTCIDHEFKEHVCKVKMPSFLFVKFNLRYMAANRHTYTCISQCSDASVGLAQAHPNNFIFTCTNKLEYEISIFCRKSLEELITYHMTYYVCCVSSEVIPTPAGTSTITM